MSDCVRLGGWFWYISDKHFEFNKDECGKWMYFFNDQEFACKICEKAIVQEVCFECKCSDMEFTHINSGVICFYLNASDVDNHKRIIQFMLDNNLIQKTKSGRYYNISFKYDYQTRDQEYKDDFEGKIKLADFIDLNTGKWIREE